MCLNVSTMSFSILESKFWLGVLICNTMKMALFQNLKNSQTFFGNYSFFISSVSQQAYQSMIEVSQLLRYNSRCYTQM